MKRLGLLLTILVCATFTSLGAQPRKTDRAIDKKISDFKAGKKNARDTVRVILQTNGDPDSQGVSDRVRAAKGKSRDKFGTFSGVSAEIPMDSLEKLAADPSVRMMSLDDEVKGHLSPADLNLTQAQVAAFLSTMDPNKVETGGPEAWFKYNVSGLGIGIAVIDSGIANMPDITNVVKTVDFTDFPISGRADPYGHGTHVAGIAAGMGVSSQYRYLGIAPQANLVNLRVLDSNGSGFTSTVIKAIEWAIANRNATGDNGLPMNIRVINLSLGHAPHESASTDPLTLACRKAVQAGMVVVVSAGNYGKDATGKTVFGGITSPATEPSVITVGAMSTWDTLTRLDDTVASYSSRGPTVDGLMKPDIAAPGSRIVGPMSPNSDLVRKNPQIKLDTNYMKLSGTSMAAPMVAGAVALMLEKAPSLRPNAVKAILMYTAERINRNPLEVGAGELNILGALNLASNIDTRVSAGRYWILNSGLGLSYTDHLLTGGTIVWGDTIVWSDALSSGKNIYYNQQAWGSTIVWGDTIVWSDTIIPETTVSAMGAAIAGQTIVWGDTLAEDPLAYNTVDDQ